MAHAMHVGFAFISAGLPRTPRQVRGDEVERSVQAGRLFLLALLFVTCATLCAPDVRAASILVNTAEDEDNSDGDCSLREAVYAANNNTPRDDCNAGNAGADTITILVNGTVTIGSELVITEAVSVAGLGIDNTFLNGNDLTRHFLVDMPDNSHDFALSNLTLEEGSSDEQNAGGQMRGGGSLRILQVGTVNIDNARFRDNVASTSTDANIRGGAILMVLPENNGSRLEVRNGEFDNNVSQYIGGAISIPPTGLTRTTEALVIERTRFVGNAAGGLGGAVSAATEAFSIVDSVFERSFTSSDFCCGFGGAASLSSTAGSLNLIERTTFFDSDSRDEGGALLLSRGMTIIRNSTFHENRSRAGGGQAIELRNAASAALFFTTLHDNGRGMVSDEAIRVCDDCSLSLTHSIVWARWDPNIDCRTLGGTITSNGYNIDGSGTCTGHASDRPMTDPELLPVGDYGDSTTSLVMPTMLPDPDSPAIDGGSSSCPGPLGSSTIQDQRSFSRPVFGPIRGNAPCDIGAVEFQPPLEPDVFDLSVSVAGSGRVFSEPAGLDCPGDCTMAAADGFEIALTALTEPGFEFVAWSGGCTGTDRRDCTVTMNGERSVSARFEPIGERVEVALDGNGFGSVVSSPAGINCPNDCEERFATGMSVTLTATAASGSELLNWAGDCTGTGTCQVMTDQPRRIIAIFGDGDQMFLDGFE